jgi:TRAP-type mannitol/chloroaromatic compound transport system permease small subunit
MGVLFKIGRWIDRINEWIGRGVAWVTLVLVVVVFVDVVLRYLFNISFVFTQELEWHLFAFIFLIGAAYTLLHEGHVRVDIIYQRLKDRNKALINLIGMIFFLFPSCVLVILTSWKFISNSYHLMEGSPDPGGIPCRFIIKSMMMVGYTLLCLQGISFGINCIVKGFGNKFSKRTEE